MTSVMIAAGCGIGLLGLATVSKLIRYMLLIGVAGTGCYVGAVPSTRQEVEKRVADYVRQLQGLDRVSESIYGEDTDDEDDELNPAGIIPGDYDDVDELAIDDIKSAIWQSDAAEEVVSILGEADRHPARRLLDVVRVLLSDVSANVSGAIDSDDGDAY